MLARLVRVFVIVAVTSSVAACLQGVRNNRHIKDVLMAIGIARNTSPVYTIQLKSNNTVLQIEGVMEFGLSSDIKRLLRRYPQITGIVLNSSGGYTYEGERLFKLIRKYRLDTYALEKCCSAATIAFVGGKRRYSIEGAYFGFHQSEYSDQEADLVEKDRLNEKYISYLRQQGIKEDFCERIKNIPFEEPWHPSVNELIESGFVHSLVRSDFLEQHCDVQ